MLREDCSPGRRESIRCWPLKLTCRGHRRQTEKADSTTNSTAGSFYRYRWRKTPKRLHADNAWSSPTSAAVMAGGGGNT